MRAALARVEVRDPRNDEQHLRAAWHPERRTVVFSHWRNNVCVATTPVPVGDLPEVVALLARAVADAAADVGPAPAGGAPESTADDMTWLTLGRDLVVLANRSVWEGVRRVGRVLSRFP